MIKKINDIKEGETLSFKSFLVAFGLAFAFVWFPQIIGSILYYSFHLPDASICVLIGNIITAIIILSIFFPTLSSHFKNFTGDVKSNYKISLKFWFKGFIVMYIANMILAYVVFPGQIAENEELNRAFIQAHPLLSFFEVVIVAPFMEEMIFRFGLRKAWGKNKSFPIVSAICFGLPHAMTGITSFALSEVLELLYVIPYGALGYAFGYLYNKTDNIFFSMSVHMTHNLISFILIMLIA